MDAVKYIKEFNRMCRTYNYCSNGCPLEKRCGRFMGIDVDSETIEALVAIIEKWSKEHPANTNGMKVYEMIPANERSTAFKEADSNLKGCGFITSEEYVEMRVRKSWWDAEYKGGEK